MLSSIFLQLVLLAGATQISGAPAPFESTTTEELFKRANPAPVSCGRKLCFQFKKDTPMLHSLRLTAYLATDDQRAWPLQSVQDAYNALVTNGNLPANQRRE
jgi:hypothetical protein